MLELTILSTPYIFYFFFYLQCCCCCFFVSFQIHRVLEVEQQQQFFSRWGIHCFIFCSFVLFFGLNTITSVKQNSFIHFACVCVYVEREKKWAWVTTNKSSAMWKAKKKTPDTLTSGRVACSCVYVSALVNSIWLVFASTSPIESALCISNAWIEQLLLGWWFCQLMGKCCHFFRIGQSRTNKQTIRCVTHAHTPAIVITFMPEIDPTKNCTRLAQPSHAKYFINEISRKKRRELFICSFRWMIQCDID